MCDWNLSHRHKDRVLSVVFGRDVVSRASLLSLQEWINRVKWTLSEANSTALNFYADMKQRRKHRTTGCRSDGNDEAHSESRPLSTQTYN